MASFVERREFGAPQEFVFRPMRLLIVSNRLPFTAARKNQRLELRPSAGGLVSGLSAYLDSLRGASLHQTEYIWIGWPGVAVEEGDKAKLKQQSFAQFRAHPVFLPEGAMEKFYCGFCNQTLWPLFHYFPSLTVFDDSCWQQYREVNSIFCDGVAEIARPGDIIWVHDYHLMLLPGMLRETLPGATIGFFLHIPFPPYDVYRILPRRCGTQILEGLLGADLIGFHTHDYTEYFLRCLMRLLGHEHDLGRVIVGSRPVKAETYPMGIDYSRFAQAAVDLTASEAKAELDQLTGQYKIVLSIDRLDYTKGIVHRLAGYELFLERNPQWRKRIVLVLVVVPSRVGVNQYRQMKRRIDELVGKINGRYGEVGWAPINYQYRHLPHGRLTALYRACDVALITPLRDGMNLVAKEYLASRPEGRGVLVLSEMAGCAQELPEAILVNPYSREEIADALQFALEMSEEEQVQRNSRMQARLRTHNVVRWAEDFLRDLNSQKEEQQRMHARLLDTGARNQLVHHFHTARQKVVFLDYDGTLVPFAVNPAKAVPDPRLIDELRALAAVGTTEVVIVSGRNRQALDSWFGNEDFSLAAEHGLWIKEKKADWILMKSLSGDWKKRILAFLEEQCDRVAGSFVEEKEYSLAWHYRNADPDLGSAHARELKACLLNFVANVDLQVLQGHKVVEIRIGGINKGTAAAHFLAKREYDFVLAAGDDWTDEDLFRILPPNAYSIRVGVVASLARFNVRDYLEMRDLIGEIVQERVGGLEESSRSNATRG